ncbi:hypothetical protein LshimejAT787_1701410 [Lyophyllum shimeji]|uniref:Uncharacterized protein n=1 Tax=Lyophyllum shimeji TaxID=47721 RepID=A0A9P3UQZ5_LYOSH|nr:hypothetical protein LshimejAT787_1701410 [Lyophyllum shimeji]
MFRFWTAFLLLSALGHLVGASPAVVSSDGPRLGLQRRTTPPFFPQTPASCPICAQNYDLINSCAAAAPVLANFTNVIFNPGAFVDVIKCACTDTFQSAYPQCVDCFTQTNQTQVLNYNTQDLPSIVAGMRKICALESSLLGNVSETNGEVTPSTSVPAPTPTSAASRPVVWGGIATLTLLALSVGSLKFGF